MVYSIQMHIHVLANVTNNITRGQSRELEKKRTHQVIPSLELAGNNSFILNLCKRMAHTSLNLSALPSPDCLILCAG